MHRRSPFAALALALALVAAPASAVRSPAHGDVARLTAAPGLAPLRLEPAASHGAPPGSRRAAWERFLRRAPGAWRAIWDRDTLAPSRIYGAGVPAPGAMADGAVAEAHALAFLDAHRDLLAPGTARAHFTLVADHLDAKLRTVAFAQLVPVADGRLVPVVGGRLSFRFQNDRLFVVGAETFPVARFPAPRVDAASASIAAAAWIAEDHASASPGDAPALVALPLVRSGSVDVRLAYRVELEARAPRARWVVYVDAETGAPLAREDRLRFDQARVLFDAPARAPQLGRSQFVAPRLAVDVDGAPADTDGAGAFTWTTDGAPAAVSMRAHGTLVLVQNMGGDDATTTLSASDGADLVWSLADDELGDAQLVSFIHAGLVKEHARALAPAMSSLGAQLQVRPNEDDPVGCNAFWDGYALNFYKQNTTCNNSARVADVVYHEFGHAFHQWAVIPGAGALDPSLGEGAGDTMAVSTTHDPRVAPGFYLSGDKPLRRVDEGRRWPDDISWDPHETGLIYAGAMWDLRVELTQALGDAGHAIADELHYGAVQRASNIPTTYAEVLAADDDDGDLSNGTPHVCAINQAFMAHGLSPLADAGGLELVHVPPSDLPPGEGPYPIHVGTKTLFPQCASDASVDSISYTFEIAGGGPGNGIFTPSGDGFDSELPAVSDGTALRYTINAGIAGTPVDLPDNPADPEYRVFVGDVVPLYQNDFETEIDGWVFQDKGTSKGDFEWGTPGGLGGDPAEAFSGQKVIGNHLDGDGMYRPNRKPSATSPVIDTKGEEHVRLQLRRWLTVQDGAFDRATIYVNDQPVWQNAATDPKDGTLDHVDAEWRFEDIDISAQAQAAGTVQVRFELASDGQQQRGGWNIDDFAVVAWHPAPPPHADADAGTDAGTTSSHTPSAAGCSCEIGGSRGDGHALALLAALTGMAALRSARGRARRRSTG